MQPVARPDVRPLSAGAAALLQRVGLGGGGGILHAEAAVRGPAHHGGAGPAWMETGASGGGGAGSSSRAEGICELLTRLEGEEDAGGPGRVMALLQELGLLAEEEGAQGGGAGAAPDEGGPTHPPQPPLATTAAAHCGSVAGSPARAPGPAGVPLQCVGGSYRASVGVGRPGRLVESVYDGVRSKIRRLQEEVKEKEDTIALLHKVGQGDRGGWGGGCVPFAAFGGVVMLNVMSLLSWYLRLCA